MDNMRIRIRTIFHWTLMTGFVVLVYEIFYQIAIVQNLHSRVIIPVAEVNMFGGNSQTKTKDVSKPFLDNQPHLVVILSYQRCGSSFFGGLFDKNPQGFYVYEPLDGLYNAIYGTAEGWNVPADIMNWKNGSQRIVPDFESRAVSKFLEDLALCRFTSMPKEFLLHRFWGQFTKYQSGLKPYTNCLGSKKAIGRHGTCHKKIQNVCTVRMGRNEQKQDTCLNVLWNSTAARQNEMIEMQPFKEYVNCMEQPYKKVTLCINNITKMCKNSHFRSTKTVRATMDSMEVLLKRNPNLRLIHLIRDPRAVVLSRRKFHSSGHSLYAGSDVEREAKLFCQNLVRDISIRKTLEEKYPGTIMEIIYDDFVLHSVEYTNKIYTFMNVTLPKTVENWVVSNTQNVTNSTLIATKWQSGLSYLEFRKISSHCREFFNLVPYDWLL